jgi:hypothetical protein
MTTSVSEAIQAYQSALAVAAASLATAGLQSAQAARAASIIQTSIRMLDTVRQEGDLTSDQLGVFARSLTPLLQQNYNDSAHLLVDACACLWWPAADPVPTPVCVGCMDRCRSGSASG